MSNQQPKPKMTREQWIHEVRALGVARIPAPPVRERLLAAKLVYGAGPGGVRGLCYYAAWQRGEQAPVEFVEVAATGEESIIQLAGTTLHETAHVLAGRGTGHGVEWKAACRVLGLLHAEAGGQAYQQDHFDSTLWAAIASLPEPTDGRPMFAPGTGTGLPMARFRPCPMGIGTRGGKSRGAGSGSRMRLYLCGCTPDPKAGITNKVRVASDNWQATCQRCGRAFERAVPAKAESAA